MSQARYFYPIIHYLFNFPLLLYFLISFSPQMAAVHAHLHWCLWSCGATPWFSDGKFITRWLMPAFESTNCIQICPFAFPLLYNKKYGTIRQVCTSMSATNVMLRALKVAEGTSYHQSLITNLFVSLGEGLQVFCIPHCCSLHPHKEAPSFSWRQWASIAHRQACLQYRGGGGAEAKVLIEYPDNISNWNLLPIRKLLQRLKP